MPVPNVSDAEWEVMQVLWDRSPLMANEVVAALVGKKDWSDRTVKTLLNRLVKKNALKFETVGKSYLYRPKVRREECVRRESRSFLSRVFGGQAGEMLCRLVDELDLSEAEVRELKQRLERKGKRNA